MSIKIITVRLRVIFHNIFNYLLIYYSSISRLIYSDLRFPLLLKRKKKFKISKAKYQFVLQLINPYSSIEFRNKLL